VDPNKLFLLDSGAQYVDGTTDITRTVHFGKPTAREKECFTRVLQVLCLYFFPSFVFTNLFHELMAAFYLLLFITTKSWKCILFTCFNVKAI
jgi:hypothetical protein